MCGIYGIVTSGHAKDEMLSNLHKMGRLQRHRGPDDQKERVYAVNGKQVGLGLVRLSILDLVTGMQPIECRLDDTAIICNGQVYNYIELKQDLSEAPFATQGDIEVALHLYRKKGLDFLQHLNGMYAGAIVDPRKNRLLLFRDRFGIKPLYYMETGKEFLFASEIKPLLHHPGVKPVLNKSGLSTFFTYRYLPGEETLFHGIKRLLPGSYLEYNLTSGHYSVKRYWEFNVKNRHQDMTLEHAAETFYDLFSDAVRIRLRSDVEVGSLLSGGIDSSAVASLAAAVKPDIKLFTMAFKEEKYNELPLVKAFLRENRQRFSSSSHFTRMCGKEALDQLPAIVKAIEEPISLGTVLPTDQVCEMAGNTLKVVLTGEGADEIFGGYRKFLIEEAAYQYPRLEKHQQHALEKEYPELLSYMAVRKKDPAERYIQSEALFSSSELHMLLGGDIPDAQFPKTALPDLNGTEHPLAAYLFIESRARLPDYVILRLDKLSMRHSLETRTPFLDYRLAEFSAGLPIQYKVNLAQGREKYICSYAYNKFSVLDKGTAFRKKQPFTIPLADWLADPSGLPDFLQEILFGDVIKNHGILNHDMIKTLAGNVSTEGVGPQTLVSEADRVFSIIVFTLWYDAFLA